MFDFISAAKIQKNMQKTTDFGELMQFSLKFRFEA